LDIIVSSLSWSDYANINVPENASAPAFGHGLWRGLNFMPDAFGSEEHTADLALWLQADSLP
jgi:hypothetical protein